MRLRLFAAAAILATAGPLVPAANATIYCPPVVTETCRKVVGIVCQSSDPARRLCSVT